MASQAQHIGNGVHIVATEAGFTLYKQDSFVCLLDEAAINEFLQYVLSHGSLLLPIECEACKLRAELIDKLHEFLTGRPDVDELVAEVLRKAGRKE